MRKISFLLIFNFLCFKGFSQSSEIKPNQGVSVPQFATSFISSLTTQPKGTVVFDKDLNVMKYWDGTAWQSMSSGWTLTGTNLNSNNDFFSLYGGTNIASLSGAATDGTLRVYSPMTGIIFSGSQYLNVDKESIQARRSGIFPTFTKTEQNLKLNPFGGNVGIGTATTPITSTLLVLKSPNSSDGTAVFKGTTHYSHFHYGTNEDTYIRGGKDGSNVIINDYPLGNVGIGIYPTTYKLEVNGTARTKEVIVETVWADYVFDKGYKLRSIDEMEAFINENKHLPNIPSATEIQSNGMKVGETNKAMMEKIEEMALYIIQLKKEIDILKAKN